MNRKWYREPDLEIPDNPRGYHSKKKVAQIDVLTLNVLNEFDSLADANIFLNKKRSDTSICNHIKGRLKKAHGFYWKFL